MITIEGLFRLGQTCCPRYPVNDYRLLQFFLEQLRGLHGYLACVILGGIKEVLPSTEALQFFAHFL